MTSTLPPLLQATSGALGSAVGNAVVFPFDLATTRMQHARSNKDKLSLITTLNRIIRRHGYKRLYSGLSADTLSTFLSGFLYFLIYTSLERAARKWRERKAIAASTSSPAGIGGITGKQMDEGAAASSEILIGTIAGVLSKRLALPISAVCIRQQLGDEPESIRETLEKMKDERGWLGLFHIPLETVPLALLPSLTLFFHERILRLLPAKLQSHPPGLVTFSLGAVSNALATIPLYPLILSKSLSMSGQKESIQDIWQREGITGLYRGLEGQLAKGFIQQGVMMLLKQRIEEAVVAAYRNRV